MSGTSAHKLTASVTYVPGDAGAGLTQLAEALVLLVGDPRLDAALSIAHNFNTAAAQQQSRRRVLAQVASSLREQLSTVEQQMHEAA
jgi:hypothetical protein